MIPCQLSSKITRRDGGGGSSSSSSSSISNTSKHDKQQPERHEPSETSARGNPNSVSRDGRVDDNSVRNEEMQSHPSLKQHRRNHQHNTRDRRFDEDGCFVYQVVSPAGITVRSVPCVDDDYRTLKSFRKDDLVAMDHIRHQNMATVDNGSDSDHGPYLRLADGSGYLFEVKFGKPVMKRLNVDTGLWAFYVDNVPHGQTLRSNPCDDDSHDARFDKVAYQPMQKIYCDKRVKHPITGVTYYQVQGTRGWVVDRCVVANASSSTRMLCDECDIQIGLFTFRAISDQIIRTRPSIRDEYCTPWSLKKGDFVAVNAIRDVDDESADAAEVIDLSTEPSDESPSKQSDTVSTQMDTKRLNKSGNANGPFLRLSDGSGWIFQTKNHIKMMEPMPMQIGIWRLRVVNGNDLHLRRQPIIEENDGKPALWETDDSFQKDRIVVCDRRIAIGSHAHSHTLATNPQSQNERTDSCPPSSAESPAESSRDDGCSFYRVVGTQGWLCDRQDGKIMMELLAPSNNPILDDPFRDRGGQLSAANKDGWSPDFVRGIASTVEGMKEVSINPEKSCMSFRPSVIVDKIRINVYYGARTVGIAKHHGDHGKTQIFWRGCTPSLLFKIFKDPNIHHEDNTADKSMKFPRSNKKRSRDETDAAMMLVAGLNGNHSCNDDVGKETALCIEETEEEELRQRLIHYMKKKKQIQEKYDQALSVIHSIDSKRATEAIMMEEQIQMREKEDLKYRAHSTTKERNLQTKDDVDDRTISSVSKKRADVQSEHAEANDVGNECQEVADDAYIDSVQVPRHLLHHHQPHYNLHPHHYHPAIGNSTYHRLAVGQYLRQQRQMEQQLIEIRSRTCRVCGFVHASASAREQHERDLHGVSPTSAIDATFFDHSSAAPPSTYQVKIHKM